jgi:hypothetical protein
MIPPHERPRLDEATDRIISHPCWCGPITTFDEAEDPEGRRYVFPHHWHRHDAGMPTLVAHARDGSPPS